MLYSISALLEVEMARNDTQVNVRMPHEIVGELKQAAVNNRRSMTAQLNIIIEEWLKNQNENAKA